MRARHELGNRQLVIVGPRRDKEYVAELEALVAELGIGGDVVFVGGVPLEETVDFYRAADVFVYPSFNETFGLPILEAMACGCPVVTSQRSCMPETAGGAALLVDPSSPDSIARAIIDATADSDRLRDAGLRRAGRVHLGRCRSFHVGRVSRSRGAAPPPEAMRVLITGGAGFIGSHTCDRLLAKGHDVVVLDALTPPVHPYGTRPYLNRDVDFYEGDVRNRELVSQPAAARRRGLPLRRIPGRPT